MIDLDQETKALKTIILILLKDEEIQKAVSGFIFDMPCPDPLHVVPDYPSPAIPADTSEL